MPFAVALAFIKQASHTPTYADYLPKHVQDEAAKYIGQKKKIYYNKNKRQTFSQIFLFP